MPEDAGRWKQQKKKRKPVPKSYTHVEPTAFVNKYDDVLFHQCSDLDWAIMRVAEQLAERAKGNAEVLPRALKFMRPAVVQFGPKNESSSDGPTVRQILPPVRWWEKAWQEAFAIRIREPTRPPVTTTILLYGREGRNLKEARGERRLKDVLREWGEDPRASSTVIELSLLGVEGAGSFDSVISHSITTTNPEAYKFLCMASLLLNEVYMLDDDVWCAVRGDLEATEAMSKEVKEFVSWLQKKEQICPSRSDQLISLLQRSTANDDVRAETLAPLLKFWSVATLHDDCLQFPRKIRHALQFALDKEPSNYLAHFFVLFDMAGQPEVSPKEKEDLERKASNALQLAVQKNPDNFLVRSLAIILGKQEISQEEKEKAFHAMELAVRQDVSNYLARFVVFKYKLFPIDSLRADRERKEICDALIGGKFATVFSQLDDVGRQAFARLLFDLAWGSRHSGKTSEAIRLAQEAARLSPTDPNPHRMLGELLEDIGAHGESEQECRLALLYQDLNPACNHQLYAGEAGSVYYYLSASLFHQGKLAEAEKFLRKAGMMMPHDDLQDKLSQLKKSKSLTSPKNVQDQLQRLSSMITSVPGLLYRSFEGLSARSNVVSL